VDESLALAQALTDKENDEADRETALKEIENEDKGQSA